MEDIRENILTYIQIYQQSPFKLITLIVDIAIVAFCFSMTIGILWEFF